MTEITIFVSRVQVSYLHLVCFFTLFLFSSHLILSCLVLRGPYRLNHARTLIGQKISKSVKKRGTEKAKKQETKKKGKEGKKRRREEKSTTNERMDERKETKQRKEKKTQRKRKVHHDRPLFFLPPPFSSHTHHKTPVPPLTTPDKLKGTQPQTERPTTSRHSKLTPYTQNS